MTPPCTTQGTQQSESRSKFHRLLKKTWRSTSLGRDGALSELEERFHGGRAPGCQWDHLGDGSLSSKSWCFVCAHRRWSDVLCSRQCFHALLIKRWRKEKETMQYTPQLVKTIVKEIMMVESSKQIHSLAACSQTQHLVVPVIPRESRIVQEDAHCRLDQQEQRASTHHCSVSIYRQTLLGPKFYLFFLSSQWRVRPARLIKLCLPHGCGRRSCCCRCHVVGKVAALPIVLSVGV